MWGAVARGPGRTFYAWPERFTVPSALWPAAALLGAVSPVRRQGFNSPEVPLVFVELLDFEVRATTTTSHSSGPMSTFVRTHDAEGQRVALSIRALLYSKEP